VYPTLGCCCPACAPFAFRTVGSHWHIVECCCMHLATSSSTAEYLSSALASPWYEGRQAKPARYSLHKAAALQIHRTTQPSNMLLHREPLEACMLGASAAPIKLIAASLPCKIHERTCAVAMSPAGCLIRLVPPCARLAHK
jgi:hypothetical protein